MEKEEPLFTKTLFGMDKIRNRYKRQKKLAKKFGLVDQVVSEEDMNWLKEMANGEPFQKLVFKDCRIPRLSMLPQAEFYEFSASIIDDFDKLDMTSPYRRSVQFLECPTAVPNLAWLPDWINCLCLIDTHIATAVGFDNVEVRWNPYACSDMKNCWRSTAVCIHFATKVFIRSLSNHLPRSIVPDYNNPREDIRSIPYFDGYLKVGRYDARRYGLTVEELAHHFEIKKFINAKKQEAVIFKQLGDLANGRVGTACLEDI